MSITGRISAGPALVAGGELEIVLVDHDPLVVSTDASLGSLIVRIDTGEHFTKLDDGDTTSVTPPSADLRSLANGAIIEEIDINVIEDTGSVKLQLQKDGGGDLTLQLVGQNFFFDATPVAEIVLTAGTDTVPTLNYVYIEDVAGTATLIKNTTGFPATAHAPVATVLVQTAASVATDGAYKVHAWTDALSNGQGHISDINAWIRNQHATWISGVVPSSVPAETATGPDLYISTTSGNVFQLHPHTFPARSMPTNPAFVVNDSVAAFDKITNLNTLLTDSAGGSMSNRFFSLVIWGVVSEDETDCKLMVNLPAGSYNTLSGLENDVDGFSNFTIPAEFRGTGFLIAELQIKHSPGGPTWTVEHLNDLRGLLPAITAGGAPGTSAEFADSNFRVIDDGDGTKKFAFEVSGVTTATTRTATVPDKDITLDDNTDSRPPSGAADGDLNGTYPNPGVDDGADATAIHDDTSGEINAIAEKTAPIDADLLVIEDSEATNAKKKIQIGSLSIAPDIFYAEDDTAESQTTGVGFTQRVSLSFTAEAADYLVQWSAEVRSDDSGTRVAVQIDLDGGTILASTDSNPDTSNGVGYGVIGGVKKVTLTAAAHTIDMDFASSQATKNVRIRRSRIAAFKISDIT